MNSASKKAILVVSFGTSYENTRKLTIEAIEHDIADAFPACPTYRAWTSKMIIAKLKKRDGLTIRQYRSGVVSIPVGCSRINYGERMDYLPECDLVVSATASPNYTLTEELFEDVRVERPMILIDLAVPRDIDPEIRKKDNITLYDMDSFRTGETPKELADNLEAAGSIVKAQMNEFFQWLEGRDIIPRIQEIKADAVEDLNLRIEKIFRKTPMEDSDRENLKKAVDTAAGKVVNKLIFGLRDSLNQDAFLECVEGLEKLYEE